MIEIGRQIGQLPSDLTKCHPAVLAGHLTDHLLEDGRRGLGRLQWLGTVGAAVGAGLEIPNAVITAIPRDEPSVVVQERVVVGEPLPDTVVLRPVPRYTEYRYAVVNDRRVIVEPRTRRIVKIID